MDTRHCLDLRGDKPVESGPILSSLSEPYKRGCGTGPLEHHGTDAFAAAGMRETALLASECIKGQATRGEFAGKFASVVVESAPWQCDLRICDVKWKALQSLCLTSFETTC